MPRNRSQLDKKLGELIRAIQREESELVVGTEGWAKTHAICENVEQILWTIRGHGDFEDLRGHIQLADRIGRDWLGLHAHPAILPAVELAQSAWDEQFVQ